MNECFREFNFIEDYVRNMERTNDMERTLRNLSECELRYRALFSNRDYEMKRFIAWFYGLTKDDFELFVKQDKSHFLESCIQLYDPRTMLYPIPVNCFDYRSDFA